MKYLLALALAVVAIPTAAMECREMKDAARYTMEQRQVGERPETNEDPMRELLVDWAWQSIRYYPRPLKEKEAAAFATHVYRMCQIMREEAK